MRLLIVSILGAVAAVCGAAHDGFQTSPAQHHRLANRSPAVPNTSLTQRNLTEVEESGGNVALELNKRAFKNAHFTYYAAGLGACGRRNNSQDHIVALNKFQFDVGGGYPGRQCFKRIRICYRGRCTGAEIVDRCPGPTCTYGALDLSEGLFVFLPGSSRAGVIYGEWEYTDGSGGGDDDEPTSTTPKPTPKPTTKTTTTTTSRYTPPPSPTSTHTRSTHTDNLAPTSTRSRSTSTTTTSTSSTATSTSTPEPEPEPEPEVSNTEEMLQALLGMTHLLQAAAIEVHVDNGGSD